MRYVVNGLVVAKLLASHTASGKSCGGAEIARHTLIHMNRLYDTALARRGAKWRARWWACLGVQSMWTSAAGGWWSFVVRRDWQTMGPKVITSEAPVWCFRRDWSSMA